MHQIAILTSDERLVEMLRTSGLRVTGIDQAELARYSRATDAPQVLVVDMRGHDQLPSGLAAYRRQHSGAGVVLVVSTLEPRLMLEAMRAGVSECVAEPLSAKALDEAVRRVLTNVAPTGGRTGVCLHRRQRRRRRLDDRGQHGGDARARDRRTTCS